MKDCVKFQEMISTMLDGELTAQQQRELEEHLALCPECRALHTAFLTVSEAVADEILPAPAGLHDKIMTGVKAVEKKTKRPVLTVLRPYMAAAACLVVIVAAVLTAKESGVLGGMTKSAEDCAVESVDNMSSTAQSREIYQYAADAVKMEESKSETTESESAPMESAVHDKDHDALSDGAQTETQQEEAAVESTPEPTPVMEPVILDVVECVLTTKADGETVTEVLSETDTKVWISALIMGGDKYADNVDASLISHTMVMTRENGEVYTVYLHYAEGEQLMLSRAEDGSEAIKVNSVRDFTEYAEATEADS